MSHKKWNNAICSNMDGPGDYHTKWSKIDRDKYLWYHLYAESEKNTKELIYKTEIDSQA